MADVLVVPILVEVPSGFERSVSTLEEVLRRAGYVFYVGEPLSATIETVTQVLRQGGEIVYGGNGREVSARAV